jgi:hypothetical protein
MGGTHSTLVPPSPSPLPKSRAIAKAGPNSASIPACSSLSFGDPFRDGLSLHHQLGPGFVPTRLLSGSDWFRSAGDRRVDPFL